MWHIHVLNNNKKTAKERYARKTMNFHKTKAAECIYKKKDVK